MYAKGANVLHTLRQIADNDEKWRQILRGLNSEFYHQTVTTSQIENYISQKMKMNLNPFFNQYLRDNRIPTLQYSMENNVLKFRWSDVVDNFEMPIELVVNEKNIRIFPSKDWKELKLKSKDFIFDDNYYINKKLVN